MRKLVLVLFALIFLSFVVVAQSPTPSFIYEQNQETQIILRCFDVNKTLCDSSTRCSFSAEYPNGSILFDNATMENSGTKITYNLTNSIDGLHYATVDCPNSFSTFYYEVTGNGNPTPDGIVIVIFIVIFIFIVVEMLGLLIWTILHFIELNVDAKDLILNISSYFGLWVVYILGKEYLGNTFIDSFLLTLIEIGAVTTVIVPLTGFAISFFKQNMKKGDHN